MAKTELSKETIWLRNVIEDLGLHQHVSSIFIDNKSVIHLRDIKCTIRKPNKLVPKHCYIQGIKFVQVYKFGTAYNLADNMTKPCIFLCMSTWCQNT